MRTGSIPYRHHCIHYTLIAEDSATGTVPILLLGGVLQNRLSWEAYIQDISPVNTVIAVDLPGMGDGGILEATYSFDFLADCIHALTEQLRIPKLHIFATSYSSIIAYEFSAKYTGFVDKLVISSSMASLPEQQKFIMQSCIDALEKNEVDLFYKIFVEGVCHPDRVVRNYDLSRKVIQKLINSLTPFEVSQFIENTRRVLRYNAPDSMVAKIDLSPLLFTGTYDIFTPPDLCRDIGRCYTGSHFGTIDHYDHLFHIGNRKMVIQCILPFFREGRLPSFVHCA